MLSITIHKNLLCGTQNYITTAGKKKSITSLKTEPHGLLTMILLLTSAHDFFHNIN